MNKKSKKLDQNIEDLVGEEIEDSDDDGDEKGGTWTEEKEKESEKENEEEKGGESEQENEEEEVESEEKGESEPKYDLLLKSLDIRSTNSDEEISAKLEKIKEYFEPYTHRFEFVGLSKNQRLLCHQYFFDSNVIYHWTKKSNLHLFVSNVSDDKAYQEKTKKKTMFKDEVAAKLEDVEERIASLTINSPAQTVKLNSFMLQKSSFRPFETASVESVETVQRVNKLFGVK